MGEETLEIKYPNELLFSIKRSKEEFEREAKFLLMIKLFELKRISSGMAAKLLGIDRVQFLLSLGKYSIPIYDLSSEELEKDFQNA
jgi:predicted HTH domain antitoxin